MNRPGLGLEGGESGFLKDWHKCLPKPLKLLLRFPYIDDAPAILRWPRNMVETPWWRCLPSVLLCGVNENGVAAYAYIYSVLIALQIRPRPLT